MESFFSRYKNAVVLMVVLLAQVILLAMQVRRPAPDMPDGHNVRLWRYWVANVITPPERLAHNSGLGIRGVWSNYIYLRHLRERNQQLQDEVDRLRLEQAGLSEDARDGQRLRDLLSFQGHYIYKTVPAQVIGTSGTDQAHVIYIDKGFNDGIRAQMPVITPDGIVGKVKNVFPGTAQVLEISDQTSGAGVMLQTTRIRGVLRGNTFGQPQMINISPDDRIKPGEPVVTSGGDQIYPRGLPVGVVERIVPDPETSYVNVVIKPAANLARLEEVLVISETADKMPFVEQKDVMQSEVDALAEKQRASDILSEKLPSIDEAAVTTAEQALADQAQTTEGDPGRPVRPPAALHPDRYTPGAAPPAGSLTPAQGPPPRKSAPVQSEAAPVAPRPSIGSQAPSSTTRPTSTGIGEIRTDGTGTALPRTNAARASTAGNAGVPRTSAPGAASPRTSSTATQSGESALPHTAVPPKRATPPLGDTTGGQNSILTPAGMGRLVESPRPGGAATRPASSSNGADAAHTGAQPVPRTGNGSVISPKSGAATPPKPVPNPQANPPQEDH